ncbi:hypothetical protein E2562_027009 [Oryza meyeriana var. granulata]|uniref:No apical meristem-associated C-terminal domain-containing protein n=1 Tax=Oryza meyeriana var. granulata TaxID=110450 RepID=A0A6G1EPV1_9ORYZ|nr:hypothetical protein E2562_027009 [Oryza meyeriana var. granulata]
MGDPRRTSEGGYYSPKAESNNLARVEGVASYAPTKNSIPLLLSFAAGQNAATLKEFLQQIGVLKAYDDGETGKNGGVHGEGKGEQEEADLRRAAPSPPLAPPSLSDPGERRVDPAATSQRPPKILVMEGLRERGVQWTEVISWEPRAFVYHNFLMSCPPMNGQPSQGFSIDNNHGSQDPPSLKSQRGAKKKNMSRRETAFTKEEDLVVCSAFLNISKDPISGVNQTSSGYYKRMHDCFNEHKPEGSNRSQIAIQHRWGLIQKAMNKFCGHKEAIDRLNESGKNEQDRIDDAVQMYERTEPFTIMHCWKILCNEAKWNNKFLELNNSTSLDGMSSPPTQGHTAAGHAESGNENIDTSRPEGRDSAKRRRSKSFTETSSSSMAVEVLQRL